ncbi:Werner Syndrome-like exonuclease [Hibiscus syriacus]|uniref:3'-5' exonuclease n=1 Tax=Hibiscus syriacus TaxID=106335 RepID=A0A6A2ZBJ6_HIBSY|nr:Werner Syndrome-like exonuclease [Hibiscus syriacus]KAE8688412.1 Werner Syndrome-like exonuclease [Hibiscus syriacus]
MEFQESGGCTSDWDQHFTEQVIQSMDAIEASLRSSSSSSPSSLLKKRNSTIHHEDIPQTRRRLPNSIVSPPPSFPFSFARCQSYPKLRYPPLRFGGRILYSRTEAEVEKAAMGLLGILEDKKKETGQVSIGFDIEWKPSFEKGIFPGKAAVMQICCDRRYCYVMHIIHSGIPQSLQVLLEDSEIIKTGVAIDGDAVKMFSDYNVSVKALEDLSDLANQKFDRDRRNWSLAALTEELFCKELPKPKKIRLGNWELYPLSKEQLQYAATDAFAAWHLYQVLKSLPDAVKDLADKSENIPAQWFS